MDIVIVGIIAIAAGAAIGLLIARSRNNEGANNTEQTTRLTQENTKLVAQTEVLLAEKKNLEQQLRDKEEIHNNRIDELKRQHQEAMETQQKSADTLLLRERELHADELNRLNTGYDRQMAELKEQIVNERNYAKEMIDAANESLKKEKEHSEAMRQENDRQWTQKLETLKQEMQKTAAEELARKQSALQDNNRTQMDELLRPIKEQFAEFKRSVEESKTQKKEYKPAEEFAYAMNKRLVGYYGDIGNPQNIMILVIKEATPGQGRASIALYRELQNTDIVRALNKWYDGLLWYRSYWRRDRDGAGGCVHSIGTPSPKEIAECAYGERVKPNQIEKTVQRLLPCILDGSAIPFDLEQQCIQSASKLLTTDKSKRNSVLETACAVYKYNRNRIKEEYQLALEENRTSRDYLYGRLLAVAHQEEYRALKKMDPDSNRETNAMRYMQQFALRPATTWKLLYEQKLKPYRRHLSVKSVDYFERKVKDISDLFNVDDYINDSPLSGEYLLGYQCQLKAFEKSSDDTSNTNNNTEE